MVLHVGVFVRVKLPGITGFCGKLRAGGRAKWPSLVPALSGPRSRLCAPASIEGCPASVRALRGIIEPDTDGYSTRRSCDGEIRGDEGESSSAPLTVW